MEFNQSKLTGQKVSYSRYVYVFPINLVVSWTRANGSCKVKPKSVINDKCRMILSVNGDTSAEADGCDRRSSLRGFSVVPNTRPTLRRRSISDPDLRR
jgi:hypothetical protein